MTKMNKVLSPFAAAARQNLINSVNMIIQALKRRDRKEPGWREKEKAEERMAAIFQPIFDRQARLIRARLQKLDKTRPKEPKSMTVKILPIDIFEGLDLTDAEDNAIRNELFNSVYNGVSLFQQLTGFILDIGLINKEAYNWALNYSGKLIKEISETTRQIVREAVSDFIATPGMTIGDVMQRMHLDPQRSQTISVTEITRSYAQGNQIAGEVMKEQFPDVAVVKVWFTNNDDLVCEICGPLNGEEIGLDESWESDDGPIDNPPAHVNCLPGSTLVLPIGRIAAGSERWYEGNIVTIETLENQLTITPNHPILTPSGWIAAGLLQEGDYILGYGSRQWESFPINIDDQSGIATIENIFCALDINGFSMPTSAPDFHGDGAGSKIAAIRSNRKVMDDIQSSIGKPLPDNKLFLRSSPWIDFPFSTFSSQTQFIKGNFSTDRSLMSSIDLVDTLASIHSGPFRGLGLGLISGNDTGLNESLAESPSIDSRIFGDLILRLSGNITLKQIVKIRNSDFAGHVYNLQTESGLYIAGGIITHNCRCWTQTTTDILKEK